MPQDDEAPDGQFTPDVPGLNTAGWIVNALTETGVRAVQWDGGAAYSVYPGFVSFLYSISRACVPFRAGRAG